MTFLDLVSPLQESIFRNEHEPYTNTHTYTKFCGIINNRLILAESIHQMFKNRKIIKKSIKSIKIPNYRTFCSDSIGYTISYNVNLKSKIYIYVLY